MENGKTEELDVDIIGGLGPLTAKEEKELRDFFNQQKLKNKKRRSEKRAKETNSTIKD